MEESLKKAKAVVRALQEAGYIAYFAGGYVRDYLMGHPSDDIDIATSASVEEVQGLFSKTIPVGVAFGIVIVVLDSPLLRRLPALSEFCLFIELILSMLKCLK